jgi:SAM-dependent methyltransferase
MIRASVEPKRCVACASNDFGPCLDRVRDRNYACDFVVSYERCAACGLVQQMPMPTVEETKRFYSNSYVHYNPAPSSVRDKLIQWQMRGTVRHLEGLGAHHGKRLLDIGCGGGRGLTVIRDTLQLDVIGLEPNPHAAENARRIQGLNVITGTFPHPAIEPASVDFVRINHVIEHVPDPIELLNTIHEALRPGGWLIGETENLDCLSARCFGRHWSLLHAPYHTVLFTDATLRDVFDRSRFKNVRLDFLSDPTAWSLSFQTYLRRNSIPNAGTPPRMPGYLPVTLGCIPLAWLERAVGKGPVLQFSAQKH